VLRRGKANVLASQGLARLALRRGDLGRAVDLLGAALREDPSNPQLSIDLAIALANSDRLGPAVSCLEASLQLNPRHSPAWLLLGQLHEARDDSMAALRARYRAVSEAQRAGLWRDEATTPAHLLPDVLNAIEAVRRGRRELFFGVVDAMAHEHGSPALARVRRALSGYLRDWDATPSDPMQRPKFFYFPDLSGGAYHDPSLQPWAGLLCSAFPLIRAEAIRVLEEEVRLPNFVPPTARVEDYVSGEGSAPSWEAFFFYRRGVRYNAHHERCPDTSRTLEALELCRIAEQAPEILFSVLKPGSHINAHHGVTNVRLVMHLPLVVPPDCALNLVSHGEHRWQEGQLVMFDDTYLHEAWNRSDQTRIVLLMDCWNPHLTAVEKLALKDLIEMISGFYEADRAHSQAQS
jgi:aspartate beta-hydroxylase